MSDTKNQISIAERLQTKWLKRFEKLLDNDELSPTDAATLGRFLMANGWSLDPSKLPQNLREKLTTVLDPEELEEEELEV